MTTHKSAVKRVRQSEKRRQRNKSAISTMKTLIKKVHVSVEGKNPHEVTEHLRKATSFIDKVAGKGIIHKNKASRIISKLATRANIATK